MSVDKFEADLIEIANLLFHNPNAINEQKDAEDRQIILLHWILDCQKNIKAANQVINEENVKKKLATEILNVLMNHR